MAIITHIVSFKYTESTSQAEKELTGSKFLAMKDSCERNGKKYILELTGGANASPEGLNDGFEVSPGVSMADRRADPHFGILSMHLLLPSLLRKTETTI